MRATSLPTALPVATAAVALTAAVLAPLAVPCSALAERWVRPVPGELARSFSYARDAPFARGAHRGVDLAAPPGTSVRAACAGRVVHAGPVAGRDEVVSLRCGTRRVSYLPLATVTVHAGATIGAGAQLGTVAAGHGGLHLGVRREGDPFGYVDPMPLLAPQRPAPRGTFPTTRTPRSARPRPAPARTPVRAEHPALPHPAPLNAPSRRSLPPFSRPAPSRRSLPPFSRLAPSNAPSPRSLPPPPHPAPLNARSPHPASPRLAPWPVWGGLALALSGAAGTGTVALRRRRRRRSGRFAPAAQHREAPA